MASTNHGSYQTLRLDAATFLSYGLGRRYAEIRREFAKVQGSRGPGCPSVNVVDFGCGDAIMLDRLTEDFPNVIENASGLDSFKGNIPAVQHSDVVTLFDHDLRVTPYCFESCSIDFAIVSAFLKHNPLPVPFFHELDRLLGNNGHAVFLDPTPTVVRIGLMTGYFDKRYTPFPWSSTTLKRIFRDEKLELRVVESRRYWIAPNQRLFSFGIEKVVPPFLRRHIGMHQCVVVGKAV